MHLTSISHTKHLILSLFFVLQPFSIMQAQAWVLDAGFEDGTVGQKADGDDAFYGRGYKSTLYSAKQSRSGKQSAVSTIREGHDGFSEWGGVWSLPKQLGEGDEFWYRVWVFYPNGFSFNCKGCSEGIKFMRTRTQAQSGEFEGSWDYYIRNDGPLMATGVNSKTFYSNVPSDERRGIGEPVTTGTWHAYEHYIKFSSTPGKGVIRAWQDGKLIFEHTATATLKSSTSVVRDASIWTYWNNLAPTTQSAYFDDVVMTNERPSNTDEHGNPYIGTDDIEFLSPPNPPSLK